MPNLGPMEILVILVVALLVLGPTKLPEAGRQLGRALSEFRRFSDDARREVKEMLDTTEPDYGVPEPAPDAPTESHTVPRSPTEFPEQGSFT